jgi:hypothetical protein
MKYASIIVRENKNMCLFYYLFLFREKTTTKNEMCVMTIIEMNYHDNELNKMKELFIFFFDLFL